MKKIVQVFKLLVICGLFGSSVFAGPALSARRAIRKAITAESATEFELAVRQYHTMAGQVYLIEFFQNALEVAALKDKAEALAPDFFTAEELARLNITPTPQEAPGIIAIREAIEAVGIDAFNAAAMDLSNAVRQDDRALLIELFRQALAVEGWRDAVTKCARKIFTAEELRDSFGIPDTTPTPTPPIGGGGSGESLDQLLRKATGEQRASQDGTSAADLSDLLSGKKLQGVGAEISWPWRLAGGTGILAVLVVIARMMRAK